MAPNRDPLLRLRDPRAFRGCSALLRLAHETLHSSEACIKRGEDQVAHEPAARGHSSANPSSTIKPPYLADQQTPSWGEWCGFFRRRRYLRAVRESGASPAASSAPVV